MTLRRILVVFVILNLFFMIAYVYFRNAQSVAASEKQPAAAKTASGAAAAPPSADAQWGALQRRQEEIRIKEQELKVLQDQVEGKIKRLEELENLIQQDVASLKTLSDDRIKHLVKIYSSMNPKAAAKLMDNMDLLVAVEVFHNMKGEVAGAILANMEAAKAATITKMLATYQASKQQQAQAPAPATP